MHTTKTMLATGLFAFIAFATAIAFGGPVTEFNGSRAEVRIFCTGEDRFLLEGGNFSLCTTPVTDVVCRDDGSCASSNLELALTAGFQRLDVAVLAGQPL